MGEMHHIIIHMEGRQLSARCHQPFKNDAGTDAVLLRLQKCGGWDAHQVEFEREIKNLHQNVQRDFDNKLFGTLSNLFHESTKP